MKEQFYPEGCTVELNDWVVAEDQSGNDHDFGQVVAIGDGIVFVAWFGVAIGDTSPVSIASLWAATDEECAKNEWEHLCRA